jgi:ribosomal protein S18 acetylase RimI-like enzyme
MNGKRKNDGAASKLRTLAAADLDSVIALDERITGRSRRGFFTKRLQAALAEPDGFIVVATAAGKVLTGFAIARLQAGEFGDGGPVATLDAIGVDPDHRGEHLGDMLLDGIEGRMRKRGVHELRTMTEWTNHGLLGFLDARGFTVAPRLVLERPCAGGRDI